MDDFIESIEDPGRRSDSRALVEIMREVVGEEPAMWGPSIVGFGAYEYRYRDGSTLNWFLVGFAPRKTGLALYIPGAVTDEEARARLGKHTAGKGCLYLKRLAHAYPDRLRDLIARSIDRTRSAEFNE